jgi:hypothetical protein
MGVMEDADGDDGVTKRTLPSASNARVACFKEYDDDKHIP